VPDPGETADGMTPSPVVSPDEPTPRTHKRSVRSVLIVTDDATIIRHSQLRGLLELAGNTRTLGEAIGVDQSTISRALAGSANEELSRDERIRGGPAADRDGGGVVSERTPFPEIDTTEGTGYGWLGRFMEAQALLAANALFAAFKLGQIGVAGRFDADLARGMVADLKTDRVDLDVRRRATRQGDREPDRQHRREPAEVTASQCDRVLAVLRDGDWHDINEIHRRAGTMRLNSRISDLRARGHLIDCKPNGAKTRYRLQGSAGAPGTAPVEAAAAPGSAAAAEQLTLDDARSARASGPEWS
jgi:hypothetical protein